MFQKAMGHSSLAFSLTYLRGLEVSDLEESEMAYGLIISSMASNRRISN